LKNVEISNQSNLYCVWPNLIWMVRDVFDLLCQWMVLLPFQLSSTWTIRRFYRDEQNHNTPPYYLREISIQFEANPNQRSFFFQTFTPVVWWTDQFNSIKQPVLRYPFVFFLTSTMLSQRSPMLMLINDESAVPLLPSIHTPSSPKCVKKSLMNRWVIRLVVKFFFFLAMPSFSGQLD